MASPVLVSVTPADGAIAVPVNSSVVFAFDVEFVYNPFMFSSTFGFKSAIQWSPNVNFSYAVSPDGTTLTCTPSAAMPANTTITWTLNPIGATLPFMDYDGDELAFTTGSFTTAGSGQQTNAVTPTVCAISKTTGARQTNATTTIPYGSPSAFYIGSVDATNDNPVSSATLVFPGNAQHPLTALSSVYHLTDFDGYATQALLDTAVPAGSYTFNVQRQSGAITVPMTLTDFVNWPPVPMISNFDQAQSINSSNAFTFQWTPMPNVKSMDTVVFEITDPNVNGFGEIFTAPNSTNALANTAGSVTIPATLLQPGKTYEGALSFNRVIYVATNSTDKVISMATLTRTTYFSITTASAVLVAPKFVDYSLDPSTGFKLSISAQPGSTLFLESSVDLNKWDPVTTTTVPGIGVYSYTDSTTIGQSPRFYRASSR